jgi:MYXO-CTERM domain-containing protein
MPTYKFHAIGNDGKPIYRLGPDGLPETFATVLGYVGIAYHNAGEALSLVLEALESLTPFIGAIGPITNVTQDAQLAFLRIDRNPLGSARKYSYSDASFTGDGVHRFAFGLSNLYACDDDMPGCPTFLAARFGPFVASGQGNTLTGPSVATRALAGFVEKAEWAGEVADAGCLLSDRLVRALELGASDAQGNVTGDARCVANGTPADSAFVSVKKEGGQTLVDIRATAFPHALAIASEHDVALGRTRIVPVNPGDDAVSALVAEYKDWRSSPAGVAACEAKGGPWTGKAPNDPYAGADGCSAAQSGSSSVAFLFLGFVFAVGVGRRRRA